MGALATRFSTFVSVISPMKKLLYASTITVLLATGCGSLNAPNRPSGLPLRYHNAQYDFTFFLPASWQGYSVLPQQWEAQIRSADTREVVGSEHGPVIVLRDPHWKASEPYQDIPILVFTRSQWDAEHQGKFFPYAGGVIFEMQHNDNYVFGIYSRFNADDTVKGWKEADDIVTRNQAANATHLYPE
jgi:hypothetical protein